MYNLDVNQAKLHKHQNICIISSSWNRFQKYIYEYIKLKKICYTLRFDYELSNIDSKNLMWHKLNFVTKDSSVSNVITLIFVLKTRTRNSNGELITSQSGAKQERRD